jgi:hypothetical protein
MMAVSRTIRYQGLPAQTERVHQNNNDRRTMASDESSWKIPTIDFTLHREECVEILAFDFYIRGSNSQLSYHHMSPIAHAVSTPPSSRIPLATKHFPLRPPDHAISSHPRSRSSCGRRCSRSSRRSSQRTKIARTCQPNSSRSRTLESRSMANKDRLSVEQDLPRIPEPCLAAGSS